MKALKWIAWISGGIGSLFVLSGLIEIFFGHWQWGRQIVNYFLVADSFFSSPLPCSFLFTGANARSDFNPAASALSFRRAGNCQSSHIPTRQPGYPPYCSTSVSHQNRNMHSDCTRHIPVFQNPVTLH